MSANYRNPSFLLPNELNQSINPDLSVDRHSLYSTEFNGTSSYIKAPITQNQTGTATIRTFSFWVKTSSTSKPFLSFFSDTGGSNFRYTNNFYFITSSQKLLWSLDSSPTFGLTICQAITTNTVNINDGNWHHIVLYNPVDSNANRANISNTKIYVDGVSQALTTNVGTASIRGMRSGNLAIGAGYAGGKNYLNGIIDEFAYWDNIELKQSEVQALADSKNSPVNPMALDPKPVAYYPLGEQARVGGNSNPNAGSSEWQFPNQVVQSTVVDFDSPQKIIAPSSFSSFSSFSCSFWCKFENIGGRKNILLKRDDSSNLIKIQQGFSNFYLFLNGETSAYQIGLVPVVEDSNYPYFPGHQTGSYPVINTWIHFALSYDASSQLVLSSMNGRVKAISNINETFNISSDFEIGLENLSGTGGSKMSNFQFWDTALTYQQLKTLFNSGSTPYTGTQPELPNLQYWYKLNAANSSYAPYNANFNNALSFDGSNNYIDTPSIDLGLENTISFWAKRNGTNMNGVVLGGPAAALNYTVFPTSVNNINYRIGGNSANVFNNADIVSTLGADEWFHCALVRNNSGADVLCYINGYLKQTLTGVVGSGNNTIVENIGARTSDNQFKITGNLSNIAVFNTALSGSDIFTLYNNGTPETSISHSPVSWWKLDAGGTTITDYGSGGNNGTNNGATLVNSPVAVEQWNFTNSAGSNDGSSTTLPISALVRSDLQFESPYSNFSLNFGLAGNFITIPEINLGTVQTVSFWLKKDINSSNLDQTLIGGNNGWGNIGVFSHSNGNLYMQITGISAPAVNFGNVFGTRPAGNWYHICIVRDGTSATLYIDGSYVNAVTFSVNGDFKVNGIGGGTNASGTPSAQGTDVKIDEVAFFNTALTLLQVNQIYNNGLASDLTSLLPSNWWRLGEDAYFVNNNVTIPNRIAGAPNGIGAGTQTSMLVADAPGSYGSGSGVDLDILGRVGEAPGTSPINVGNSQSYNMIPDDRHDYVPGYTPATTNNIASMDLDGTNDYFDIGNPTELQLTGTLTFSAWFKTSTSDYQIIISKDDVTNRCFNLGLLNTGYVYGQVFNSGSSTAATTTTTWDDGVWHHVAFVYIPSTSMQIFIDGSSEKLETSNIPASIDNDPANFNIGRRTDGARYFNGNIDEVAVFNYALTEKQIIEDIYNASKEVGGVKKTADLNNNSKLTAPIAWYRMGD